MPRRWPPARPVSSCAHLSADFLTPRLAFLEQDTTDLDWHDREIRFDVKLEALELRRGEVIIDSLEPVEDTKGNNGESGVLQVTNLRMIWMATANVKTNLSVGYGSVVNIHIRTAQSRLKGNCEALYVLTKYNGSRFEFIFTNLVRDSPRLFTTVQAVFRSASSLLFGSIPMLVCLHADVTMICPAGRTTRPNCTAI